MDEENEVFQTPQDLLVFWFGEEYRSKGRLQSVEYITGRMPIWFNREAPRFEEVQFSNISLLSDNIAKNAPNFFLSPWRLDKSNEACLARMLLYDQFPRTCFRGTPRAFDFEQACHLNIHQMIENAKAEGNRDSDDLILSDSFVFCPIERFFISVALQHSEDFRYQTLGYDVGRALISDAKVRVAASAVDFALTQELCDYFKSLSGFPQEVYDVVVRFGRFPTRNEVLGRVSSKKEVEWLECGSRPTFLKSVKAKSASSSSQSSSIAPSRSGSPGSGQPKRIPYGEMVQQLWAEGQARTNNNTRK